MLKKHKDLLREKRVELVENITLDHDVWDILISQRIINESQREKIELNAVRKEQVGRLLNHLTRRDDGAFDRFCEALIATDQEHVVTDYLQVPSDETASGQLPNHPAVESPEPPLKKQRLKSDYKADIPSTAQANFNEDALLFDLVDSPHKVFVEKCLPHFYRDHHQQAYQMNRRSRGHAIIINVKTVEGYSPRTGTDIDRDKLEDLLRQLHFDNVLTYNDEDGLSGKEILEKVCRFTSVVPASAQACVVCVLSHGEDGRIYGTDGSTVCVSEIERCLSEENAPSLAGKPKMLILQACRGKLKDEGVEYDEGDALHPASSDLIICYPTVQGYMAWRNQTRGSWYIAGLVQVFQKHTCRYSIHQLMTQVNSAVSRHISRSNVPEMDGKKQTPEFCSRLRKEWYFFPGHFDQ